MHTSVYRKPKMNIQIINVKVSGASVDPDLIDIFTIYWLQKNQDEIVLCWQQLKRKEDYLSNFKLTI
jgi:hypothetical protein